MRVVNIVAIVVIVVSLGVTWWLLRSFDSRPAVSPGGSGGSGSATAPAAAGVTGGANAPAAARPSVPDGAHPAPFEAYAGVSLGDWLAYRVENHSPFGDIPAHALRKIEAATASEVTVSLRGRLDATGDVRDDRPERFPRAGLTLERLTGDDIGGWTIHDVVVTDEPHVVGGRTFPCKKIAFASDDPMFPTKQTRTELWISEEVPVGGLVEKHEVQHLDGKVFEMRLTVVGFGSATATTWGERPSGL